MEVKLPWGGGTLGVTVPDTWTLHYPKAEGKPEKAPADDLRLVKAALAGPVKSTPIEKMKLKGKKVVIVVDDNTRPTPADRFFHLVLAARFDEERHLHPRARHPHTDDRKRNGPQGGGQKPGEDQMGEPSRLRPGPKPLLRRDPTQNAGVA